MPNHEQIQSLRVAGTTPEVTNKLNPRFLVSAAFGWLPEPTQAMITPAMRMTVATIK